VHTLKADPKQRVRLPEAKPGQVFAYEKQGEGRFILTLVVKTEAKPRFPKGSLLKYFTGNAGKERDKLETAIASGCLQGPPK
jgi:hypothetical protein